MDVTIPMNQVVWWWLWAHCDGEPTLGAKWAAKQSRRHALPVLLSTSLVVDQRADLVTFIAFTFVYREQSDEVRSQQRLSKPTTNEHS